jgi:hypothetical protein
MKSLVVKSSAKNTRLKAAIAEFNKDSAIKATLNEKFKFSRAGYHEIIFPKATGKNEKKVFQAFMHKLANLKVWVECMNVTITSAYGQEYVKAQGARYSGVNVEIPYRDIVIGEKTVKGKTVPKVVRAYDQQASVTKRNANLLIDGADRLGHLNHRKYRMRYDKIRWFTNGVIEEQMKEIKDDEGNVVGEEPSGNYAMNFDFEKHGHSEQYSNYKHFRRKYFDIVWAKWTEDLLGELPRHWIKQAQEKPVVQEIQKEDISTLTGQALFDALNGDYKRPKNK